MKNEIEKPSEKNIIQENNLSKNSHRSNNSYRSNKELKLNNENYPKNYKEIHHNENSFNENAQKNSQNPQNPQNKNQEIAKSNKSEILNLNNNRNFPKKNKEIKEFALLQKKYLKENSIKKSKLLNIYQMFFPKRIKSNKNIFNLLSIKSFVEKELDILNILKKLIEYENFKSIFLSDNQNGLMRLLQRRVIHEFDIENDVEDYYSNVFFENTLDQNVRLLEIFDEFVVSKESLKDISKKIIDRLGKAYDNLI